MALLDFLNINKEAILASVEEKTSALAGVRPKADLPNRGLTIFYQQFVRVLEHACQGPADVEVDREGLVKAAYASDESALALAAGRPFDAEVATIAGAFGKELQHLGYTLSHVVHAYGAICQSITEVAIAKNAGITTEEFRELNRCLDTAIAGAVTVFHAELSEDVSSRETEHLGFLAHELRNGLAVVNTSLRLIKKGSVGFGGSIGQVLDRALKRLQELIDRSLAEVRLRVDPEVHKQTASLHLLIAQMVAATESEVDLKNISVEIDVDPALEIDADQYLLFSAVSNLVQNAIKYTCSGGTIRIRGHAVANKTIIEIEDQCGGLSTAALGNLFKPFQRHNANRDGMGLGLPIAQRAIALNGGTIDVENLPGSGCIFRISLPDKETRMGAAAERAVANA
jgi:signal transduction histidine kinase